MAHNITETLWIGGMTCPSCERRISGKLEQLPGVVSVQVNYSRGTAKVRYDPEAVSRERIIRTIESMDYTVGGEPQSLATGFNSLAGILLILLAVYLLARRFGLLDLFSLFPQAEAGMGYGMLFVIGLLTSVHCVAMCGGINLSQCLPAGSTEPSGGAALRPSLLYNLGRVVSYTVVGAIVGALGSVVSFSGAAQGLVQLAAGVFMVIMGINMLGLFPWLRRLTPRLPGFLTRGARERGQGRGPLVVGLLNGLMPCGPLQAMQLYALSTGDPVKGALSMLLFSLGTVPLMFGLGALSTVLSKKFTGKMMTAGAVLVVVLGVSMFGNGLALSGFAAATASGEAESAAPTDSGVQVVNTTLERGRYAPITVTKGVPVQWTITAEPGTVTGCNNRLIIREYGIEKQLEVGDNLIEFTPESSGTFAYSCWMGMIRSSITVTEADGTVPEAGDTGGVPADLPRLQTPAGYTIPTDSVAVAVVDGPTQSVRIDMDGERFSPAVVVLQAGLETEWTIHNSGGADGIAFPLYNTLLPLADGENLFYLLPTQDFDFATVDSSFFGYVKVVEDIAGFDEEAVLREASEHITYTVDAAGGSGMGCCM